MLRTSRIPSGRSAKSFVSAVALAFGVAGGAAMLAPSAAVAQDYSSAFRDAYKATENLTKAETPNWQGAAGTVPALTAAAQNPDEMWAAGNMILTIGQNTQNSTLQRQGLTMMVDSGKTPPEEVGRYNYFLGNFALQAEDYDDGRRRLMAAVDAGYVPEAAAQDIMVDPRTQLLQSYFFDDDNDGALAFARRIIGESEAAGQAVSPTWLQFGLQAAYNNGDFPASVEMASKLVEADPSAQNWRNSLLIVQDLGAIDDGAAVDLYRLMDKVGAMQERREFYGYIEGLDPRLMSNEVKPVLAEGLAKGVYTPSDEYYVAVKEIIDNRAANDAAQASQYAADANSGGALEAYEAAQLFYSIGDYAQAEEFYNMALDKGSADADRDRLRLALSQVQQGKMAEADTNLAQVSGARAPIAKMWQTYIATQS